MEGVQELEGTQGEAHRKSSIVRHQGWVRRSRKEDVERKPIKARCEHPFFKARCGRVERGRDNGIEKAQGCVTGRRGSDEDRWNREVGHSGGRSEVGEEEAHPGGGFCTTNWGMPWGKGFAGGFCTTGWEALLDPALSPAWALVAGFGVAMVT